MVGSAMFVPASAGILLANYVFMDIIKETEWFTQFLVALK
jgi:tRNA A37 threonylcarbamoyladenosine dehydratase